MSKVNTVLFDFDGTIMDTNEVIIRSWQHTFKTVEGKERPKEHIIETFGEPLYVTMEKLLPQIPLEEGVSIYRGYHYSNFKDLIEVFPGVIEVIKELKNRDYKVAIVTSRLRKTTCMGLEKYDMEKYFDSIITCDDTDKHKPDPEPINIALERLKSSPNEAIMVGDSMFDILCAKNAGVKSAFVGWSLAASSLKPEEKKEIDYFLESAWDIFNIL